MDNKQDTIVLQGIRTHNLKNVDITLPKNKIITITGVSGSGKSSLAFDTIYKEGQFRYIESLSSYLRQFFNLGDRPDIEYSYGLSPAIAIEQNKRGGNMRSTVGTLTEIDDYLRLLFAKAGDLFCYKCGTQIKTKTVDQIVSDIRNKFVGEKIYLIQELQDIFEEKDLVKFVRKNRKRVETENGYVRYLMISQKNNEAVEYFYLEEPNIPKDFFPIKLYGIYDRVTIEDSKIDRLKEDIIKILAESKKFGVYSALVDKPMEVLRYTDKNFCANCNITYPDFTTQYFSPNRPEGACEECHGIGETLQVDFDRIIEPGSTYLKAILPWRDSALGQGILEKLAHKYSMDTKTIWNDLPNRFQDVVINGDNELYRIGMGGKFMSMYYKGIKDILTQQYHKGILTVDFQSMFELKACESCGGAKLRKESLNVFLTVGKPENLKDKKILILHGFGSNPEKNFFPRIKTRLENLGAKVFIPQLPNADNPKLTEILEFLQQYVDQLDENSVIIGHSMGCSVAMHLLQKSKIKIEKLLLVAPTFQLKPSFEELEKMWNMDVKDLQKIIEKKFDIKKINKNVKTKICLMSENDPYIASESKDFLDKERDIQILPDQGHFQEKINDNILDKIVEKNLDDIRRYNIFDLQNKPIQELTDIIGYYKANSDKAKELLNRILTPLLDRAGLIRGLGLGYLTLYRQIDTLSGGEIQRLRLAKQLGNRLTGIIYVLDEPTIGLDTGEIQNTIKAIKSLKEMGNTIIVVEHNDEFIKNSDWVVEVGPGAGDFGGKILFNGPFDEFLKSNTLTSKYMTGKKKIQVKFDYKPSNKILQIRKATKHNLKNIDIDIKLGSFTIITGASGAGKTTLMYHILYRFLEEKEKFIQSYIRLGLLKKGMSWSEIISAPVMKKEEYEHLANLALQEFYKNLGIDTIKGYEHISNVIYVDQTSIGKTPRSCPATFIGVFDDIRKIFAGTSDARMIGFDNGHFSFNSGKGACPECNGYGYKKIELQFLPDTYVPCELCRGSRYKPEILSIKWHDKNISQLLDMYVEEAFALFKDITFISDKLQLMCDIGLGYLKMGQPAHTLSGGESQRLKLVKHLLKSYRGHSIYFLDEPTVGLHPSDIEKLLKVLGKFLENGDTILMIEHDKSLLKFADEVIRLEDGKIMKGK